LIDGIDVVDAFGTRSIALMHGIDAQIAGSALRIRSPALADANRRGPGFGVVQATFPVALLVAQVVQVSHRDGGQPLVLRLPVVLVLALQNAPRGRSAQGFVGLIDRGQPFDIGAGIALWKAVPAIVSGRELSAGPIAGDQPRHLGPAQAGHLLQVAPQQAARFAALFLMLLLAQKSLHPAVNLLAMFAFEPD